MTSMRDTIRAALPGLLLSATIALAVRFVSDQLGGPAMLYALLFGMAFNFLTEDERFATGIYFASRNILRFGVALLGLRITVGDVTELGWPVVALVMASVVVTILVGGLIGRAFGLKGDQSVLSAGAVAICGASAALAIASVLPSHKDHERNTIMTVAGVTALSTVAMVFYPVFVTYLEYDNATAGVFLGATIHDVAQVVGAGYSISEEAGVIATYVKILRVALLPVVMLVVMLSFSGAQQQRLSVPWFLVMFALCAVAANSGLVPSSALAVFNEVSRWCLMIAISALGVKTSLGRIIKVKPSYSLILIVETLFLLSIAVIYTMFVAP